MLDKKQKILIASLLVFSAFFALSSFCSAQTTYPPNSLETEYPDLPGLSSQQTPTSTQTALPTFIRYFFHFIVLASGLIIFLALIKGGMLYLRSAGNAEKTKLAKEEIFSSFIGVLIVLCSWLVLDTINPQLLSYNISSQAIQQITPPASQAIKSEKKRLLQIPVGMLIEQALLGTEATANINEAGQNLKNVEQKAGELKKLNKELKDLALSFTCGNSSCNGCHNSGYSCGDNYDQSAVDAKIQEINNAIDELKAMEKDEVRPNRWDINNPRYELKTAAALITGACPSGAITQNDYVGLKELEPEGIEVYTLPGWPSNIITDANGQKFEDPATFYCEDPDVTIAWNMSLRDEQVETIDPADFPSSASMSSPTQTAAPAGSSDHFLQNYPNLIQNSSPDPQVKSCGCGPTSLTTVVRYFGTPDKSIEALAYELESAGAWPRKTDTDGTTYHLLYHDAARNYVSSHYGLTAQVLGKDVNQIKEQIMQDRPVVISCNFDIYRTTGHVMVIYGVNYTGGKVNKFYIINPWKNTFHELSLSNFAACKAFYTFYK